jgi:hypothetical protein
MVPMPPPAIPWATYHGGFSYLDLTEPIRGYLVISEDAFTLERGQSLDRMRRYRPRELCRILAIASIEVTSEQAARSRGGTFLAFGALAAFLSKATEDRATMIVTLKSGDAGFFTVQKHSTASLLALLTPWMRERGIPLGTPEVEPARPTVTASLIADELAKLAQLRDSGVLSEDEFVTLKTQLIQETTG